MDTLKQEVIKAISTLPENVSIDDIMYRVYVIEKVRKGKEAVKEGETVSVDELKREIKKW
jgi:hypothetical protein